jgi:hypothetical protein
MLCTRQASLTFAVLCSKQYRTNLELLNHSPNVGSNGSAIKSHHKQLALHVTLLANALLGTCILMAKQPTIVLQHGYYVSRTFGHIARSVDGSAREAHLSRSSQTGSSFSDLAAMMAAPVANGPGSELSLRWALGLERDSQRLVNG